MIYCKSNFIILNIIRSHQYTEPIIAFLFIARKTQSTESNFGRFKGGQQCNNHLYNNTRRVFFSRTNVSLATRRAKKKKKKLRRDCSLEILTTGIFLEKNLTTHKAGRLRATLPGLSGKHRVVAIFSGWTEIMRRRRREMRAQLCLKNFFFFSFFLLDGERV